LHRTRVLTQLHAPVSISFATLIVKILQAAEKDPHASLRSIASLQRTVSTPPLAKSSRASPLDLFEQPARVIFQQPAWI
jgi:hypothetical protein